MKKSLEDILNERKQKIEKERREEELQMIEREKKRIEYIKLNEKFERLSQQTIVNNGGRLNTTQTPTVLTRSFEISVPSEGEKGLSLFINASQSIEASVSYIIAGLSPSVPTVVEYSGSSLNIYIVEDFATYIAPTIIGANYVTSIAISNPVPADPVNYTNILGLNNFENLTTLSLRYSNSFSSLSLSPNKLESLSIQDCPAFSTLPDLSGFQYINSIEIRGPLDSNFTEGEIDTFFEQLADSVNTFNRTGTLTFQNIGLPSVASLSDRNSLESNGWTLNIS